MSWLENKDSEPEKWDRIDLQAIGCGREAGFKYGVCNGINSDVVRRIEVTSMSSIVM